jgi:hypothetical protein
MRCDADLASESVDANRTGELRMQHLDRDLPIMTPIMRQPHGRHSASAELAIECVSVSERSLQSIAHVDAVRIGYRR